MKKKLRKGFTLVEVIVATAITGLLIAAVMALFGPVRSIIGSIEEDVVTNNVTDVISNYITTRIERSTSYNIDIYDYIGNVYNQSDSDLGSLQERFRLVREARGSSVGEETHCLILKNVDGNFKLYDLGKLNDTDDIGLIMQRVFNPTLNGNYNVFKDEYYNNKQFRYTFKTASNGDVSAPKVWCEVGVKVFNEDDTVAVEARPQTFRLLNMSATAPAASNATLESLENTDYDQASNYTFIAIFYNIKDYTAVS